MELALPWMLLLAAVAVVGPLEVLGGLHRHGGAAVADREQRHLGTVEKRFEQHRVTVLEQFGRMVAGDEPVELLLDRAPDLYDITVFGSEPYGNYNRILLSPVLAAHFGGWGVAVMMGGLATVSLACVAAMPETLPRRTTPR